MEEILLREKKSTKMTRHRRQDVLQKEDKTKRKNKNNSTKPSIPLEIHKEDTPLKNPFKETLKRTKKYSSPKSLVM